MQIRDFGIRAEILYNKGACRWNRRLYICHYFGGKLSEEAHDAFESKVVGRKESIQFFGYTDRFRCGKEKNKDSQYGNAERQEVSFAFARHFVISEQTKTECTKESDQQTGQGENTEKKIGHDESYKEDRHENERQVVSNQRTVDIPAHIINPVENFKPEEAERNAGKHKKLIPCIGQTVTILAEPPGKDTDQDSDCAADNVIPCCGDKGCGNHGKRYQYGADDNIGKNLADRHPPFLRNQRSQLCQDFQHEDKKEYSQCGKRIDEQGYDNQKNRDKDSHALEYLQLFKVQFLLLCINGQTHENQIGKHDAYGFCRKASHISQSTKNQHSHIGAGKTADEGTENADVQKGYSCINEIQNIHLLQISNSLLV